MKATHKQSGIACTVLFISDNFYGIEINGVRSIHPISHFEAIIN
jgi:hypothetical protein